MNVLLIRLQRERMRRAEMVWVWRKSMCTTMKKRGKSGNLKDVGNGEKEDKEK